MKDLLRKIAVPTLVAAGTLGVATTTLAGTADAATRPAHTFALRGKVVNVDMKTGRVEIAVGKKDVTVAVKAADLKTVKRGETVAVRGDIVRNVRVATSFVASGAKPHTTAVTGRAKAHTHTFTLRGKVVNVDMKTGRVEIAVGKKDVTVEAKAAELKMVKRGETVAVRGDIVRNVRVATSLLKA